MCNSNLDIPYQIKIFAFRNFSREIQVNENKDRLLTVDVVRKQGVLGRVTVGLNTVPGILFVVQLDYGYFH